MSSQKVRNRFVINIIEINYSPIKEPSEIPYKFGEAWNNYDADGIANLFFDKADFVNVTGKWWDKKNDIRKAHDYGFKVILSSTNKCEKTL